VSYCHDNAIAIGGNGRPYCVVCSMPATWQDSTLELVLDLSRALLLDTSEAVRIIGQLDYYIAKEGAEPLWSALSNAELLEVLDLAERYGLWDVAFYVQDHLLVES